MLKEFFIFGSRHGRRPKSLNPCFSGTCSKRSCIRPVQNGLWFVLILVLVEHAQRGRTQKACHSLTSLNPCFSGTCSKREQAKQANNVLQLSLNPCFSGTCSKRAFFVRPCVLICYVVKFTLINVFVLIKCTCFVQKRECKGNKSF